MNIRIPPKEITPSDVEELLKLQRSDITSTKLKSFFAIFYGQEQARFQPNDTFTLRKGQFYNNTDIKTTVGRYILNIFCMPKPFLKKYGYLNTVLDDDGVGDIEKKMGLMILNDELSTKEYAEYMDNTEWYAHNTCYYITPSLNKEIITPIPEVIKKRDEMFDKYKSEIEKGDLNVVNVIEKELLSDAKKKIEADNNPSYDCYKSGVFKFPVAYKKCDIMVGAISDPKDGKLHILKSDYTDGVIPEEYDKTAQLTVIGGYSRGVATQEYGYESKKYNASMQNVSVDIDGTNIDCGTDKYLEVKIPAKLSSMYLYRYIIENGKIVELTPENIKNYEDKVVKLRSPMFCKSDIICQHCAGSIFKRMDIKEVGLVASNLTGNLLNLSMKKMHDSTVKISKTNIEDFIIER